MSQSVSERQTPDVTEPDVTESGNTAEQPTAVLRFDFSETITAEAMATNAEGLMDLVFADVDRMLERGVALSAESAEPSAVAEAAAEAPTPEPLLPIDTILPPKLAPRDLMPQAIELIDLAQPEATEPAVESSEPPAEAKSAQKGWSLLWVAVLFGSLTLSGGIVCFLFRVQLMQAWLMVLTRFYNQPVPTVTASPTVSPANQPNADFLQYLGRALDRLSQHQPPSPSPEVAQNPSPTASPSVVERVYVPVYPTGQTAPNGASTVPSTAPNIATVPLPSSATAPAPAAKPQPTPAPHVAPSAVPNIAAETSHTLVGVLELGERSAALFEVAGTPQRVEIGEQIGSSGWSLVSVSNQEAIVRRNGEVRSIYVGQKF